MGSPHRFPHSSVGCVSFHTTATTTSAVTPTQARRSMPFPLLPRMAREATR